MSDSGDNYTWLRTRPPAVQKLMLRFPPSCVVRARPGKTLRLPAPGRKAVVSSYMEKEDGTVNLTVLDYDVWAGFAEEPAVRAECDPEWLTVESYLGNMTPDWVRRVLAGEDVPPVWED